MKKLKKILNEESQKMTKYDYIIIGIIVLLYSILSFINLGSFTNPQTTKWFKKDVAIDFVLEEASDVAYTKMFHGEQEGEWSIYVSTDGKDFRYIDTYRGAGAFAWNKHAIPGANSTTIRLVPTISGGLSEVAFYKADGTHIPVKKVLHNNKEITVLTDEQDVVPEQISITNTSYFDEVYFARTAYNYLKGMEAFEWVHPPLGKMIQAIPLLISGTMAPFYYRLMGNLSGIAMIYVMYLFGKLLFKNRKWSIFLSLLMFFDTFHFAQTRMGTIDSHLVLFIMISIYFMYRYVLLEKPKYSLFLSGVFFGLSICVKWIGFLGGLALAIIYFTDLFKNKKPLTKSIVQGTLFFVIMPLIMYITCYMVYPDNQGYYTDSIKDIIDQTILVYDYHSHEFTPHDFSSEWYSWPLSYKPVWYHSQDYTGTIRETSACIGNIVIWWTIFLTIPYMLYRLFKKKDKEAFLILIVILSLWLPFIFIGRVMFLYHYFPTVPFVMIAITKYLKDREERTKNLYVAPIYLAAVVLFFIIFYPVVSGMPITNEHITNLRILESWYF